LVAQELKQIERESLQGKARDHFWGEKNVDEIYIDDVGLALLSL
jgi:hypothetical protein